MNKLDVAVVGAGPYGLSLGSHLQAAGLRYQVYGTPLRTWLQHMPEEMYLKSEGCASNIDAPGSGLTLKDFCAETGRTYGDYGEPVSIDSFSSYGLWFRSHAVPELVEADVESIRAVNGGFRVEAPGAEPVTARKVVVAAGVSHFGYVPSELAGLPHGLVTHASEHRDLGRLAGSRVAVVGGGQSALETAAILHERGATPVVVVRKPQLAWNETPTPGRRSRRERLRGPMSGLGAGWKLWSYSHLAPAFTRLPLETRVRLVRETLGPAGGWWLRKRFEGHVEVLHGRSVLGVEAAGEGVTLRLAGLDGEERRDFDHVIAATGYRVDLDRLAFLAPVRKRVRTTLGSPVLSLHFESTLKGVYFTGLAAAQTFGPVMRFVYGTEFASPRVARHLRRSLGRGRSAEASARATPAEARS